MKKLLSLLVLAAVFTSCGEEIKFNTPAFQANKNLNIWQASEMQAFADAGGLTIIAAVGTDVVTLHTASANAGTYTLGGNVNVATYESVDGAGASYTTAGMGSGSGKIVIAQGQTTGTITGSFTFVAKDGAGNPVKFTDGAFYRVPKH